MSVSIDTSHPTAPLPSPLSSPRSIRIRLLHHFHTKRNQSTVTASTHTHTQLIQDAIIHIMTFLNVKEFFLSSRVNHMWLHGATHSYTRGLSFITNMNQNDLKLNQLFNSHLRKHVQKIVHHQAINSYFNSSLLFSLSTQLPHLVELECEINLHSSSSTHNHPFAFPSNLQHLTLLHTFTSNLTNSTLLKRFSELIIGVSKCVRLVTLNISMNKSMVDETLAAPDQNLFLPLQSLSQLESLRLNKSEGVTVSQPLLSFFLSLPSITELCFGMDQCMGEIELMSHDLNREKIKKMFVRKFNQPIVEPLLCFPSLSDLSIFQISIVPWFLSKLSQLISLNIYCDDEEQVDRQQFATALAQCRNLTSIEFSHPSIISTDVVVILSSMVRLRILKLYGLTRVESLDFVKELKHLHKDLRELYVYQCDNIECQDIQYITMLSELRKLDLMNVFNRRLDTSLINFFTPGTIAFNSSKSMPHLKSFRYRFT